MKSLSAIAKELGVSVATVSYVYNGKWRENRIRPDLADRIHRKLQQEHAAPNALGQQLRSGRTQTVGVLLPYLDQPYFLKLLAGIERRLGEAGSMVLLGIAHWQWQSRQADLLERMLARRVDALLMSPRPADDLVSYLRSVPRRGNTPLVFVDNYLPECPAPCVLSDNRWGAREAVRAQIRDGRQRILFFGGSARVAALRDRYLGYCDALKESRLALRKSLVVWHDGQTEKATASVRRLLQSKERPDAIFAGSFLGFHPVLQLLDELKLRHPHDVLLAGFDEPLETWTESTVRRVIRRPLLSVIQPAEEMGRQAVEIALAAIAGGDGVARLCMIRPALSWESRGRCAKRSPKATKEPIDAKG
ncbi:MAG: LacI family DNA-binding transcriptional regulator [Planctomycetota bacterium]